MPNLKLLKSCCIWLNVKTRIYLCAVAFVLFSNAFSLIEPLDTSAADSKQYSESQLNTTIAKYLKQSSDSSNKNCKILDSIVIDEFKPVYPKELLMKRVEGVVEMLVTISKIGLISKFDVIRSDNIQFENAAKISLLKSKFKLFRCDSTASEIVFRKKFNFVIQ